MIDKIKIFESIFLNYRYVRYKILFNFFHSTLFLIEQMILADMSICRLKLNTNPFFRQSKKLKSIKQSWKNCLILPSPYPVYRLQSIFVFFKYQVFRNVRCKEQAKQN